MPLTSSRPKLERIKPYMTLNAFGLYVMTRGALARRTILRDLKFYHPSKSSLYAAAREPLIRFMTSAVQDATILEDAISRLQARTPENPQQKTRFDLCAEILQQSLLHQDRFRFEGLQVARGCDHDHQLEVEGVTISLYPEILVRGVVKKRAVVGAIKFRFVKKQAFDDEAGGLCSTLLKHLVIGQLAHEGDVVDHRLCRLVDVYHGCRGHEAPKADAVRLRKIREECEDIATIWPTLRRSDQV